MTGTTITADDDDYGRGGAVATPAPAAFVPAIPATRAEAPAVQSPVEKFLRQPVETIRQMAAEPLRVGQKVVADTIADLKPGGDKTRIKEIGKTLGGIAASTTAIIAVKAALTLVVTTALPAAASVIVPAAFLLWSTYKVGQHAEKLKETLKTSADGFKQEGMSDGKAFLMALKQNKFKAGIMIGSAVMLAVGAAGTLSHISQSVDASFAAASTMPGTPVAASKIVSGSLNIPEKKPHPGGAKA